MRRSFRRWAIVVWMVLALMVTTESTCGSPARTDSEDANRETFIVAQIETPEAVRNIDEIAVVPASISCSWARRISVVAGLLAEGPI